VTQSPDHEARISRLEARVEEVAADASAARHLAAAGDRDLAELTVKVDANRKAINALGEQTRARFDQVDARFDEVDARFDRLETEMRAGFAYMHTKFAEMDRGFAEMRHGFDQSAAGFARIAELIEARGPRDDDR
jgi:outer membrane murein-binding lipoprotein Lpp